MCGRFSLTARAKELASRFGIEDPFEEYEAHYNIAPSMQLPVVLQNSPNHVEYMFWGLIPYWAKKPTAIANARAETIFEKPTFKQSVIKRRCIVPSNGYFEWTTDGKSKQPHYFRLKDQDLFGFAGIYDEWQNPETPNAPKIQTFALVTTSPNALASTVHHRMPVILRREDEDVWLDMGIADEPTLMAMMQPYPADKMEEYQVTPEMNKPSFDNKAAISPIGKVA